MNDKTKWIIGNNMPGYLPDDAPDEVEGFECAKACIKADVVRVWEDDDLAPAETWNERFDWIDKQTGAFGFYFGGRFFFCERAE